jgi:putative flippase GtrA
MINKALNIYEFANQNHPEKMKIFRYIISGGMATLTNLVFLFIFTELFGIWYLLSAIISYIISFAVSFTMQKFWTFQDGSKEKIKSQAIIYIIVTTLNLGLNTLCIYLFVEFGFHYLFAQILSSIIIAIESFFVYKYLFKTQSSSLSRT